VNGAPRRGGAPYARPEMVEIGYQLSSEEHPAPDLVGYARRAEETGFAYAVISDHYHPWTHQQGQASFVWTVLGAIAQATNRLRLGTAVTAPIRRTPPYLVAQAAATAATLLPGRFFLGVGTGENLNEHITGDRWPPTSVRREMLEEAVEIIRKLWAGGTVEHFGRHYTVDNARVYSRPSEPPPIIVAAGGPDAAEFAARIGDGLIAVEPSQELVEAFDQASGTGKPRYAQLDVCVANDEAEARRIAHAQWTAPAASRHGSCRSCASRPTFRPSPSSSPRSRSASASYAATIRRRISPASASSSTPASTTSTSTKSAPTRRRSSTSTNAKCSRACGT
jgi:coenzyme F420-dependent glucose-6-phosphate dehydrogenase